MKRTLAAARQRCPRCLEGPVFRRFIFMNATCPACGLKFEREPGYFTGAMYVSYTLGIVTTAPLYFAFLYFGLHPGLILGITSVQLLVCIPLFFRYSRVLWMYLDMSFNPPDETQQGPPHDAANNAPVRTLRN